MSSISVNFCSFFMSYYQRKRYNKRYNNNRYNSNNNIYYDKRGNKYYYKKINKNKSIKNKILTLDNIDILIHGYIKQLNSIKIPNVIIQIIYNFFDKNIYFNVFDINGLILIRNCKEIFSCYRFIDNIFYVTKSDKLFHSLNLELTEMTKFKDNVGFISSGINDHSYIYTKKNELYSFDIDGDFPDYKVTPTLITTFDDPKDYLKQIKCGANHALFLTANGAVFGTGDNVYGQLTKTYVRSNDEVYTNIMEIISTHNIININCSAKSSFILNNNNILKVFGKPLAPKE